MSTSDLTWNQQTESAASDRPLPCSLTQNSWATKMHIGKRLNFISIVLGAGLTIAACGSSGTTPTTGAAKSASLQQAVTNTLSAPNYSEVVSQNAPQGKQTDHLRYQAPDRLGGYIQSGSKRTYVYVIGSTQYQSQAVPNNTSDQATHLPPTSERGSDRAGPRPRLPSLCQSGKASDALGRHVFVQVETGR